MEYYTKGVVAMKLENKDKLTDADLEQVIGGDKDLADDSRYLNVLLRGREGQCGRYGSWRSNNHYGEVVRAWASVGVVLSVDDDDCLAYCIDGKEISRHEAWLHAEQVVGKHLKRADWDW